MRQAVLQPKPSAVDAPRQQDRGSMVLQPLYSSRARLFEVVRAPDDPRQTPQTLLIGSLAACQCAYPAAELAA